MAKRKASLDDVLGAATRAERVVELCVAGDLFAEHQQAVAELAEAQRRDAARSTMGVPEAPAVAQRVRGIEERMRDSTFTFRFRALSDKQWSDLLAAHPARDGQREAFNVETFPIAAIAACCVEPDGLDTVEAVGELFDRLPNQAQRSLLFDEAWRVNTGAVDVPFSAAASAVLQVSAPNSTTAVPVESPGASSSE